MKTHILTAAGLLALASGCGGQDGAGPPTTEFFDLLETPVGEVNFPNSCAGDAEPLVERGVALLHHMMYDEAAFVFGMARDADPDCALADWGEAMTLIHPLWPDIPSASVLERGMNFVEHAKALSAPTDREALYIQTAAAYFEDGSALSEHERLERFEASWKALADAYPEDLEARAFYSLALRALWTSEDRELAIPQRAGAIAESVLAETPDHPGAHHYIIHAYDFPELAERAVDVAEHYGEITPRVPHASHMMTHIYTRLGDWPKAVEWNRVSAESAWALCVATGEISSHYTHALDYLAYAHLQLGQDEAVLEILRTSEALQPPFTETNRDASAYAFAALPARYVLERRDWKSAAELQPRAPEAFPWEASHDAYVANTHFARAIGLAHLGRARDIETEIAALAEISERLRSEKPYWAQQVAIQEIAARALRAYAAGAREAALDLMREAAHEESLTQKHAVTPGEILPAAELYGDMLLEAERFDDALAAYRMALARSPRRLNGLYGAGKAALGAGDLEAAAAYFSELKDMAGAARDSRPAVDEALSRLAVLEN
ncbi:MAG: hypothetical protein Tsb0010_00890 [Parvularculaceae bacterium]